MCHIVFLFADLGGTHTHNQQVEQQAYVFSRSAEASSCLAADFRNGQVWVLVVMLIVIFSELYKDIKINATDDVLENQGRC